MQTEEADNDSVQYNVVIAKTLKPIGVKRCSKKKSILF